MDGYLAPSQKKTLDDNIESLYQERWLHYVRSARHADKFFISSSCCSENTKKVTYLIDIVISKEGMVGPCQCDCGAGMGPTAHCKHVQVVLFGLISFASSRSFVLKQTCTQQLQSFHKCKTYKGSPLKAHQFTLRPEGAGRELKRKLDFDPRPQKFRKVESYQSYFNNLCVGYQASQGVQSGYKTMPILHSLAPANVRALANDHDYLEDTMEDWFLDKISVRNITKQEISNIEKKTRGQSKAKDWFHDREIRLTSSNFGRICKLTDRTNVKELVSSFMSPNNNINSKALQHGLTCEKVAIERFEQENNTSTQACGMFVSKSHPYLAASPDAIMDDETLLEVKCPFSSRDQVINEVTVPYLKCVHGELTLDKNHNYFYQIQGQLFCSERKVCKFVVYTFKDCKTFTIPRDETFIATMIEKLAAFYEDHFHAGLLSKYFFKNTDKYTFTD